MTTNSTSTPWPHDTHERGASEGWCLTQWSTNSITTHLKSEVVGWYGQTLHSTTSTSTSIFITIPIYWMTTQMWTFKDILISLATNLGLGFWGGVLSHPQVTTWRTTWWVLFFLFFVVVVVFVFVALVESGTESSLTLWGIQSMGGGVGVASSFPILFLSFNFWFFKIS